MLMHRRHASRRPGYRSLVMSLVALIAVFVPASSWAHQPHDVIEAVAISPNFVNDGVVFATLSAPNNSAPLRSTDGGLSFNRIVRGLDNRSLLTSIAISPEFDVDPVVFFASDGDGIYRSLDGGDTFSKANTGLESLNISMIKCEIDSLGRLLVLAAGGEGGLFRSLNGGQTWHRVLEDTVQVSALAFSSNFNVDHRIAVGDRSGFLWASFTKGSSWRPVQPVNNTGRITDVEFSPQYAIDQTLFFSSENGAVHRSVNNGRRWTPVNTGLQSALVTQLAISPNYGQDQTMFCVTDAQAVYKSINAGNNWTLFSSGIRQVPQGDHQSEDGHYWNLEVSDNWDDGGLVMTGGFDGLFRSNNGGLSYVEVEVRPAGSMTGLVISDSYPNDLTMILSRYGGGLTQSPDGGANWSPVNIGVENPFVYGITSSPDFSNDRTAFAMQATGILVSQNGGLTWQLSEIRRNTKVYPSAIGVSPTYASDQTVIVGSRSKGLYLSDDGGQTWDQVLDTQTNVVSIAFDPNFVSTGVAFVGVTGDGVYRTSDGGQNWTRVENGLPTSDKPLISVSPNFATDQTVFIATRDGLFVSTDGGNSFSLMGLGTFVEGANVELIAVSPDYANDDLLMISVRGIGVFQSTDFGASWTEVANSLIRNSQSFGNLYYSPQFATDGVMFGLSDSDLWMSSDRGVTWSIMDRPAVRYENYHQQFRFLGTWATASDPGASAGSARLSAVPGDEAVINFVGTGATWIGATAPLLGFGEIYIDGIFVGEVDLYSPTLQQLVPLASISGLPNTAHELRLVVSNRKNDLSSDTGILVDAVDVEQ